MTTIQQNNLSAGELSPNLYGRTDLQKYHSGTMRMLNAFVDYRGGANSRPGTQFIGYTEGNTFAHLVRFTFSSTQTYMLVFSSLVIEFIRNPLTPARANASNAGFIETTPGSGVRYSVATPYGAVGDLQLLKFSQSGDVLTITHPAYPTTQLTRIADNNWVLANVPNLIGTSGAAPPQGLTLEISAKPSGSTDPATTTYGYVVTSVDQDGQESGIGGPQYITGINIATTQGTIALHWDATPNAQFYNVYKAVPTTGLVGGHPVLVSPGAAYGFIGAAYGPSFTDTNIIADFSQSPPFLKNPLANGQIIGYTITSPGSGYLPNATDAGVDASAWLVPVVIPGYGGLPPSSPGSIGGFVIRAAGHDIVNGSAITVTGSGSGFAGTVQTSAASGAEPAVSCYFQQRRLYAGSNAKPLTINGSKIGLYNNFDTSNPPIDSDAYEFTISAQEINRIKWMLSLPGGLLIFTDGGVLQLTGGSATVTNPVAVTPTSAVIVPQSAYGAADVVPITINHEVLYVQSTGGLVRDLTYNLYANTYTGTDLTLLSTHLFTGYSILDWAYQDVPHKAIWTVRSDGNLLSLTFLKEQDLYGWAQHNSPGSFVGVESVQEGSENATYFVVNRNGHYCIERLCGRQYSSVSDAWCLDSALSIQSGSPVATVSGLGHLEGLQVRAFVDGAPQGPFTVASGAITLTTPGRDIVVGLGYTVEIQQLPPEPANAPTAAGKLNRTVATTTIVKDTGPGLMFGTSFDTLKPFKLGITSTDARWVTPYQPPGLLTGEQRMIMDPVWNQQGGICVRMTDPMPVTILSFINEIAP